MDLGNESWSALIHAADRRVEIPAYSILNGIF